MTKINAQGHVVWFTGLSGAGKTTLAHALAERLTAQGRRVEVLDGDAVREHLSKGLGFSREDRDTNVRRIAFVAGLLARHGVTVLVSAISPYRDTRNDILDELDGTGEIRTLEIFVDAPLGTVLERDPKGLYARALRGEIQHFTGVSDPYEPPITPDVHLRTDQQSVDECLTTLIDALEERRPQYA